LSSKYTKCVCGRDSDTDSNGELTALPTDNLAGFEKERNREGRGMGKRKM